MSSDETTILNFHLVFFSYFSRLSLDLRRPSCGYTQHQRSGRSHNFHAAILTEDLLSKNRHIHNRRAVAGFHGGGSLVDHGIGVTVGKRQIIDSQYCLYAL